MTSRAHHVLPLISPAHSPSPEPLPSGISPPLGLFDMIEPLPARPGTLPAFHTVSPLPILPIPRSIFSLPLRKPTTMEPTHSPLPKHIPVGPTHSPLRKPTTMTPTHSPLRKPATMGPTHSPVYKHSSVSPTHSPLDLLKHISVGPTAPVSGSGIQANDLQDEIEPSQSSKSATYDHYPKRNIDEMASDIMLDFFDEAILDVVFVAHRKAKTSVLYKKSSRLTDIYGNIPTSFPDTVFNCHNCNRQMVASKYAPHLARCMGKGGRRRRLPRKHYADDPDCLYLGPKSPDDPDYTSEKPRSRRR
eukprot:369710_1